jgi:hypothetical protein
VLWQYKKEYAKNLANKSGASNVVNQMFEFDNGINKISDWQKIRKRRQGLKVIGKYQHPRSSIWKPSAIEKWALQYHINMQARFQLHARIFKMLAVKFVGHHIARKTRMK